MEIARVSRNRVDNDQKLLKIIIIHEKKKLSKEGCFTSRPSPSCEVYPPHSRDEYGAQQWDV